MVERDFVGELERIAASAQRARPRTTEGAPGGQHDDSLAPVARSVLALQASAGNAAVTSVLPTVAGPAAAPSIQRQPNQPPPYLAAGQAALKQLFPKEKLLQGVVIKDYAGLNKTLQGGSFGAWTNSSTEIFIKDPALFADTPAKQAAALQYILQHEANHVRQFAKAKGPPKTWEAMAKFEIEAYTNDVKFLTGPGVSIVTDVVQRKELLDGAQKNLKDLKDLVKGAAKKKGKDRETFFLDGLLAKDLIPPDSTDNPLDLYKP